MPRLDNNDANFQKPAKNICTNKLFYPSHSSMTAIWQLFQAWQFDSFSYFMFISKVNFVTLAQIVSETQHQKRPFPWQVMPEKSDHRVIFHLFKQC